MEEIQLKTAAPRRVLILTQRPSGGTTSEMSRPSSSTAYRICRGGRREEGEGEGQGRDLLEGEKQQKNEAEGRERLKRHREEVAGKVAVPENWGQEKLLKEWIDYAPFDKLLAPAGLASAREALAAEGRRVGGGGRRMRIESRCC